MSAKSRFVLLLPLCLVALYGCSKAGGDTASLTGKVTYKGEPVPGGMMTIHTKESGFHSFSLNADGTFSKKELPPGSDLTVTLETETLNPTKPSYGGAKHQKDVKDSTPEGASVKGNYRKIPRKYADIKTSPLRITLNKGENKQDFELTD